MCWPVLCAQRGGYGSRRTQRRAGRSALRAVKEQRMADKEQQPRLSLGEGSASPSNPVAAFLDSCVWHGSLERAEAILAEHPEVASSDIHTAAVLGDDAAVRRFLALDAGIATAKGGPRGWDALTYLCFSKYLRLDPARSGG